MSDLTTLADVKAWLKITATTDDALLQKLIASSSAFIESWLSRPIASAVYTEVKSGLGSDALLFGNYPVTAVGVVKIDNMVVPQAADCTQAGYDFDDIALYLQGGRLFTKGIRNVTITYTAGFLTIPADVDQACMELVGRKYRERDRIGVSTKTLAGEIVSFTASDMTDEIKSLLRNYQKVVPT